MAVNGSLRDVGWVEAKKFRAIFSSGKKLGKKQNRFECNDRWIFVLPMRLKKQESEKADEFKGY